LTQIFALLGSVPVKAGCKMLVKLTPGYHFKSKVNAFAHIYLIAMHHGIFNPSMSARVFHYIIISFDYLINFTNLFLNAHLLKDRIKNKTKFSLYYT